MIIYGTGVVGLRSFECISQLKLGNIVDGFMVTSRDNNWKEIDEVPIKELNESTSEDKNALVLVATNPRFHEAIGKSLSDIGFSNIYFLH